MKSSSIDIAVLCLFFNRPENFGQVFEQVKKARPSKLFLYQDGPRNDMDMQGIIACREIASCIDWDCEIHRLYQDRNYGCDPSEYISQKWMFDYVDKGIVLEDDDVPSQSFFPYCKELLDKYENDTRISIISGINYAESLKDCPYSYIFTRDVAIWGWATWKRVINQWESDYLFLKDKYHMGLLHDVLAQNNQRNMIIPLMEKHGKTGIEHYETILMAYHYLNSGLTIVPAYNMINNIGLSGGMHYSTSLNELCMHDRRIFEMKRFEIEFPLKHPKYVIENVGYNSEINKILDRNRPLHAWWHYKQGQFIRLFLKLKSFLKK